MDINFNGPSGPLQVAMAVIVGLGAIGFGGFLYLEQTSAVDSTEKIEATIQSTAIERVDTRRGTDDFSPKATFNYTFRGENHISRSLYPGGVSHKFGTKEEAKAKIEDFEQGTTVTAYVPTDNPQKAFLLYETSKKPFFLMGFGGILFIGSILSFLRS